MTLGDAIRFCRTQRGLSQTQLAQACEISVSYLSMIERNKRDPLFSVVTGIAKALDMPLVILLFIAADMQELGMLDAGLREKLSYASLVILGHQKTLEGIRN